MCCFTRPVISVSATNIFARAGEGDRQFLAYSMVLNTKEDLAMVLPLPVKVGTGEGGVSFIDLSEYADFFSDLNKGFPIPTSRGWQLGCAAPAASRSTSPLKVFNVGKFEASFVPTMSDFARLDERFRISNETWIQLPLYSSLYIAITVSRFQS